MVERKSSLMLSTHEQVPPGFFQMTKVDICFGGMKMGRYWMYTRID